MMGKAISNETQLPLFNILLNWIVILVLRNFLFGIGPARDFNNHVENLGTCCWRGSKEGDIMPWGHNDTVLLEVDAVVKRIGSAYQG